MSILQKDIDYFADGWGTSWMDHESRIVDYEAVKRFDDTTVITYYFVFMLMKVVKQMSLIDLLRAVLPSGLTLISGNETNLVGRYFRWKAKADREKSHKAGSKIPFFISDDFEGRNDDFMGGGDGLVGVEVGIPDQEVPDLLLEPPPPKMMKASLTKKDLEAQIKELKQLLQEREEQIVSLHKKVAGKSRAFSNLKKINSLPASDDIIRDTRFANGFIQILDRVDCMGVDGFTGIEFLGVDSDGKDLRSYRKENTYVSISELKKNTIVSHTEMNRRSSIAVFILSLLSGCSREDIDNGVDCDQQLSLLFSKIFAKKTELGFSKSAGIGKLSVSQAVDLVCSIN